MFAVKMTLWEYGGAQITMTVVVGAWLCSQPVWHQQRKRVSSNFRIQTWRLHKIHQREDEPLRLITCLESEMVQCNKHWRNNTPERSSISKEARCQMWAGGRLVPQPHSVPWHHPCRSTALAEKLSGKRRGEKVPVGINAELQRLP